MDRTEIRLRIIEAFIRSDRRRDTWAELNDDVAHFEAIVMGEAVPVPDPKREPFAPSTTGSYGGGGPRGSNSDYDGGGGSGGSGDGVNGTPGPRGGAGN